MDRRQTNSQEDVKMKNGRRGCSDARTKLNKWPKVHLSVQLRIHLIIAIRYVSPSRVVFVCLCIE
jgi:hypothetical protein